jgi:hypothetical protein
MRYRVKEMRCMHGYDQRMRWLVSTTANELPETNQTTSTPLLNLFSLDFLLRVAF